MNDKSFSSPGGRHSLRWALLFLALLVVGTASASPEEAEPLRIIVNGPSVQKMLLGREAEFKTQIGRSIKVTVNPVAGVFPALERGMVDCISSGTKPELAYAEAKSKGLLKLPLDAFEWFTLSDLPIQIALHPDNSVPTLNESIVKDIVLGKIKNWQSVNGKDLPLTVVLATSYAGVNKKLSETFAIPLENDRPTGPTIHYTKDRNGILREIQKNPGAIGFLVDAAGLDDFMPKFIPSKATMPVYFIMKKAGSPDAHKLFELLRLEAKK